VKTIELAEARERENRRKSFKRLSKAGRERARRCLPEDGLMGQTAQRSVQTMTSIENISGLSLYLRLPVKFNKPSRARKIFN
jgi:hypothetical protein